MKRFLQILFCIIIILLAACSSKTDTPVEDNHIPDCYKDKDEYFDTEAFQDYTDFCKYYYDVDSDSIFASMSEYRTLTNEDKEKLKGYFDDFSSWISFRKDVVAKYDFDPDKNITDGDYYYIKTLEGQPIGSSTFEKYDSYTVYYYDIETHILYYIHNNI